MNIALFGGSFNPPHWGHVLFCQTLANRPDIDEVWMIPCFSHPFGKELAPFEHRMAMCECAIPSELTQKVKISHIEAEIKTGRTIDLIHYLLDHFPEHRFFFCIGADILAEAHQWKSFDEIKKLVEWIIIPRVGWEREKPDESPFLPDISSREIRRKIASDENVDHLLPKTVSEYIQIHHLYLVSCY